MTISIDTEKAFDKIKTLNIYNLILKTKVTTSHSNTKIIISEKKINIT